MKHTHRYLVASIIACAFMVSCSSGDDDGIGGGSGGNNTVTPEPQTYDIRGKVEKGPFISGSDISIQPMNEKLQVLGNMFSTSITDDLGNFQLGSKEFTAPYAEIIANGYFFNEVSGELSNGTLSLRALVDVSQSETINVNILTHLKYARIKKLVGAGKSFDEANSQAQEELFEAFGLSSFGDKDASSFSIIAGTDESAALIAISSLLLMDRTEAALTEYLARLSEDFGKNGCFSDNLKKQIDEDKTDIAEHLSDITDNIIERYESLGITVTVKELSHFFDWDNDGVAGNEFLKSDEEITLEPSTLNVPNEGGIYSVKIESPIAVYLEPQMEGELIPMEPPASITPDNMFGGLYEAGVQSSLTDKGIECEAELVDNTLTVTVSKLQSKTDKTTTISLYDYVGNVVAKLEIMQARNTEQTPITSTPLLGMAGQQMVASIASSLAEGIAYYNIIEQFYNYNKLINKVDEYIYPSNSNIYQSWSKLYEAVSKLLQIKKADVSQLNVYADYYNVLSAFCYSNLVYGWGAVPYITDYETITTMPYDIKAETPENIFGDIESKLLKAIDNLEEKRNNSVTDINGVFFTSKDVARVLLANIYMYENHYDKAMPLLQKVIDNNFYTLDASTNFAPSSDVNSDINADYDPDYVPSTNTGNTIGVKESTEVIFALLGGEGDTRAQTNIVIQGPGVMPYITLSDVYLSLAECYYKSDDANTAMKLIKEVADAKSIKLLAKDALMQIKEVREQILLYSGTYFAFLKRTGIAKEVCDIEDYQLLLPIPSRELQTNPNLKQNDGY